MVVLAPYMTPILSFNYSVLTPWNDKKTSKLQQIMIFFLHQSYIRQMTGHRKLHSFEVGYEQAFVPIFPNKKNFLWGVFLETSLSEILKNGYRTWQSWVHKRVCYTVSILIVESKLSVSVTRVVTLPTKI